MAKKHPYRDLAGASFICGCDNPNILKRNRLAQLDFEYEEQFKEKDLQWIFKCRNCQRFEVFIEYYDKNGTTNTGDTTE